MAILAVGFDATMRLLLVLLPMAGGLLAVVLTGIAGRIAQYLEDMTYRIRARSSAKRPPPSDTARESGRSGHCDGSGGANDVPTGVVGNGFVGQKHGAE